MKRFLSILLVLTLIFGACSMTACELFDSWFNKDAPPTPSEGLEFKLSSDGAEYAVVGIGNCGDLDIVIPDTYKGKPVTAIGVSAFSEEDIKSVYIPSSVEEIGELAFAYCKNLENVTLNEGIKTLKEGAFMYCYSLAEITIPNTLIEIRDNAFLACASLKTVNLHENITHIGNSAFEGCISLETLAIPGGIEEEMFKIYYGFLNSLKSYEIIGKHDTFYVLDGNLYYRSKDSQTHFLSYAMGKADKEFTVPGNVDSIAPMAFSYMPYDIEDVLKDESLTDFKYRSALEKVIISEGVLALSPISFTYCTDLTTIVIPKSVTYLSMMTFVECPNLESIEYNGTMEEWENVYKISDWFINCPIKEIKCSDGTVCAHGFTSEWETVKEPTINQEGLAIRSCDYCGYIEEKVLEKLKEEITIWVSTMAGVKEFTAEKIEEFMAEHPEYSNYCVNIETVGEGDAASEVLKDIASAPDIYCFAQDQIMRLVQAEAIAPLDQIASATVKSNNEAGSVNAATIADRLYAYPMTSDNGYYLYYDASVVSDEEAKTLEGIIAACERAGKKFGYNLSNGWVMSSFFFAQPVGGGAPICKSAWTFDVTGRNVLSYDDTFNSENGLIAMKAMQKLASSSVFVDTSDNFYNTGAMVTGIWNAYAAEAEYGENLRAVKLPTYTVDGQEYQLGSFSGYKLMGCKPQQDADKAKFCQDLAIYLTSEECQLERYYQFQWGPSNVNAQADEDVQANVSLSALLEQNAYSQPQRPIPGDWWAIAACLGTAAEAAEGDADLVAALEKYQEEIDKLLN